MLKPTTQLGRRFLEDLPRILLWGLLWGVLIGVIGLGIWSLFWQEAVDRSRPGASSARLPVYGSVPDFTLVDQHNHPLRKTDLEGKIWVANFMFTNCPDECPLMTAAIAQLQSDLADVLELRLVSITVDPEHDTPAVLAQYAQRFQADPRRWFFLTGDKRAIYHLARQGFRLGIVDPTEHTQPSPSKSDSSSPSSSALDPQVPEPLEGTLGWRPTLPHWWDYLQPSSAFANHGRAQDTLHSTRFVLVDQRAQIRGYYDSQEDAALQRLRQHLRILRRVT